MALPNLSFISSNDNHHHIILLNNDRGVSHNKASVPKIVQTVIQAFAQNHIFLLV
jgi:catechol-2,3-dioxygenase